MRILTPIVFIVSLFTFIVLTTDSNRRLVFSQQSASDCKLCHTCDTPTKENPCLMDCPRNEPTTDGNPESGPDVVILNELEDLYVPVRFAHKMHAKMAGIAKGCEICHHYPETENRVQTCKECHPKDIIHEDLRQPGLKGAYHRQCLGCHSEWDKDTACAVCHEKKAGGKLHGTATTFNIHRHYQPVNMEELITFKAEDGDVPFHHKRHAELYNRDCTTCHKQESCAQCHTHTGAKAMPTSDMHPMGDLAEIDLHETCFQCHEDDDCEKCHGQDPNYVFSHKETGWPMKAFHEKLNCRDCHAQEGKFFALDKQCTTCHVDGWEPPEDFDHKITGVALDETHVEAECTDCHTEGIGSPALCNGCHDDDRKYDPQKGFTSES